jgi:hypothetical protein
VDGVHSLSNFSAFSRGSSNPLVFMSTMTLRYANISIEPRPISVSQSLERAVSYGCFHDIGCMYDESIGTAFTVIEADPEGRRALDMVTFPDTECDTKYLALEI